MELAFTDLHLRRVRATVVRDNLAFRRVLQRMRFRIARANVREVPRYGRPARPGDTFVLEGAEWIAGASRHASPSPTDASKRTNPQAHALAARDTTDFSAPRLEHLGHAPVLSDGVALAGNPRSRPRPRRVRTPPPP